MVFKKLGEYVKRKVHNDGENRENAGFTDSVVLFSGMGYKVDFDQCINISDYIDKIGISDSTQSSIFCDIIKEQCMGSVYIDGSNTMLLTNSSFEGILDSVNTNLNNLKYVDPILHENLVNDTLSFFSNRKVVILQEGVQGAIYKAGRIAQSYGSTILTVESVMMSRLLGVTGSKVLAGQPLLWVALPTVGGIFFHGMSMIIGNNVAGRSCQTVGNVLLIPMRGSEILINNLLLLPLGKISGIPMILNMTDAINMGPGLSVSDAKKLSDVVRNGKLSPLWGKISKTFKIWFTK